MKDGAPGSVPLDFALESLGKVRRSAKDLVRVSVALELGSAGVGVESDIVGECVCERESLFVQLSRLSEKNRGRHPSAWVPREMDVPVTYYSVIRRDSDWSVAMVGGRDWGFG